MGISRDRNAENNFMECVNRQYSEYEYRECDEITQMSVPTCFKFTLSGRSCEIGRSLCDLTMIR